MKTAKKTAIYISVGAICLGILLSFIAMASMNFDFLQLNTINFESKTYTVEEDFTNISIIGAECDIELLPANNGKTTVECSESDKIHHEIKVENGTLTVKRTDDRQWYEHFGVYWAEMSVTVYLPKSEYDKIYASALSGDIKIPNNFTFTEAEINNTSGDTEFFASVSGPLEIQSVSGDILISKISAENIKLQSTSGDIEIYEINANDDISLKTVSGEIEAQNINCQNLTAKSTSGEIEIERLIAKNRIETESVSGNIGLTNCDGENLKLSSTSGDIRGTLLSEKIFLTYTTSGNVNVPYSATGGTCEIKTTSGNIHFKID